jgi:hypothetical protein
LITERVAAMTPVEREKRIADLLARRAANVEDGAHGRQ